MKGYLEMCGGGVPTFPATPNIKVNPVGLVNHWIKGPFLGEIDSPNLKAKAMGRIIILLMR